MVEGAPLLREYRHKKLIEGSNPSLSATDVPSNSQKHQQDQHKLSLVSGNLVE